MRPRGSLSVIKYCFKSILLNTSSNVRTSLSNGIFYVSNDSGNFNCFELKIGVYIIVVSHTSIIPKTTLDFPEWFCVL